MTDLANTQCTLSATTNKCGDAVWEMLWQSWEGSCTVCGACSSCLWTSCWVL